jgi:hypothetical protein
VPQAYRDVSYGLGSTRWQMVTRVVLRSALPGIGTGIVLSIGRSISETAAVMLTAGSALRLPRTVFDSSRTLALHFYTLSREGLSMSNAYATAAILILATIVGCATQEDVFGRARSVVTSVIGSRSSNPVVEAKENEDLSNVQRVAQWRAAWALFKKHPVFDGLDAGHILDDRFSRIMPFASLRIEGAETLGGVFGTPVGYHFKIKGCEHARDPRFGSDLCMVQYEKGKLIFSTYQLEQNLGKDPVADRILWNMLRELKKT